MDILYVITKSNWGGAQKYVFDLSRAAKRDGRTVAVALGGAGPLAKRLRQAGIEVITIPSLERDIQLLSDWRSFRFLYHLFKERAPRAIHLNSSKIGVLGALAGRIAGVPRIVFTAHGWVFNEDRSFPARAAFQVLYWCTILLSHTTIAVSRAIRRQMSGWPFIHNRIVVIHHGITAPTFLERHEARQALQMACPPLGAWLTQHPKTPLIGTVAELHPVKGLADAIRALGENTLEVGYVIIGEGEIRPDLESLIKAFRLEDRVFLAGHVSDAAHYLHAFDMILIPSHSEAFSYAVLEACAAGKPIVATRVGGIPEILQDNETGLLIRPRHPSMLASAIRTLLEQPELAKRIGAAAERHAEKEFDQETMLARTLALYGTKDAALHS